MAGQGVPERERARRDLGRRTGPGLPGTLMNGAGPLFGAVSLIVFLVSPSRPVQSAALFYCALVGLSWLWSRYLRRSVTVERTVSRLRVPRNERLELVILARNNFV